MLHSAWTVASWLVGKRTDGGSRGGRSAVAVQGRWFRARGAGRLRDSVHETTRHTPGSRWPNGELATPCPALQTWPAAVPLATFRSEANDLVRVEEGDGLIATIPVRSTCAAVPA